MTPHEHALERLLLAEEDLYAARSLTPDPVNADRVVGYNLQQVTEKLLKALLAERNVDYPRTHSLRRLISLVVRNGYSLPEFVQQLGPLTRYAVLERYSIRHSVSLDRSNMLSLAEQLWEWVKEALR